MRFFSKFVPINSKILSSSSQLTSIKVIHTLIWVFYNIVIFYMLYAVITDRMDTLYWVCWGLVLLEGLILAFFRWTCPLTLLARRHTSSTKDNFDIYLPNWLARHTKTIYTVISLLILALTIYRWIK